MKYFRMSILVLIVIIIVGFSSCQSSKKNIYSLGKTGFKVSLSDNYKENNSSETTSLLIDTKNNKKIIDFEIKFEEEFQGEYGIEFQSLKNDLSGTINNALPQFGMEIVDSEFKMGNYSAVSYSSNLKDVNIVTILFIVDNKACYLSIIADTKENKEKIYKEVIDSFQD